MAGNRGGRGKSKEKFVCESCSADVGPDDKALQCSVCEKWSHIKCERVSVTEYELLRKTDDSIQWFCKLCRGASQKLYKMLTLVHKRQDQFEEEIKGLSTNVKVCNTRLEDQLKTVQSIEGEVTKMREDFPNMIASKVGELFEDRREEESREKNLVFFNVKEKSDENDKTDNDSVKQICSEALGVEVEVEETTRLGRFQVGNKDRPLRVTILQRTERGNVLKNAYKLKNNQDFRKIGIGKDLTQKQRLAGKKLREELNEKKREFPGKIWAIRRDKIVEIPGPRGGDGRVPPGTGDRAMH